jgi:4-amino-4-deoxychorismate lyase
MVPWLCVRSTRPAQAMDTMWVDGGPQESLPLTDRALHYGDGLFETIAVHDGSPRLISHHLDRLRLGCQRLSIMFTAWDALTSEIIKQAETLVHGVLKCIISRGSGGRGYYPSHQMVPRRILIAAPYPEYPNDLLSDGARLRFCITPLSCHPQLAGIKHLNRLENVLARSEWDDPHIDEGVMLNINGDVIEGTMSNLFWVRNGILNTPDVAQCGVAGVMRREVIAVAAQQGIEFQEVVSGPPSCLQADEIFITNSLMGIRVVHQLADSRYKTGPVTRKLFAGLQLRISGL